jgi:hypothetical protein
MDTQDTSLLNSGQNVGLVTAKFPKELADFEPLQAAETNRAELVAAMEAKQAAQDSTTTGSTSAKDDAREVMARATEILSARAVGYALATKQLGLKQAFTLSYTDVRFGEATEDVNHVRELVKAVQALPADVRLAYRLTDAIIKAPDKAAALFEAADDTQTDTKAAPRLATLALPDLLRQLSAALLLMKTLLKGQSTDTEPKFDWPGLYAAFKQANKRQKVAASSQRATPTARIVRTLPFSAAGTGQPQRLANTNYGPSYTLTVENRSATPLLLWMAQKDGAATTPHTCPAGAITTVKRADIGPETARYLTAQFQGAAGGEAMVVVRRVV